MSNPTTRQSYVYVLHAQGTPRVKLGVAYDVEKRRKDLQTGCPYPLVLLAAFPCPRHAERKLHRHFAAYRKSGEYFELPAFSAKPIMDFIKSVENEPEPPVAQSKRQAVQVVDVRSVRKLGYSVSQGICLPKGFILNKTGCGFSIMTFKRMVVDGKRIADRRYSGHLSHQEWMRLRVLKPDAQIAEIRSKIKPKYLQ